MSRAEGGAAGLAAVGRGEGLVEATEEAAMARVAVGKEGAARAMEEKARVVVGRARAKEAAEVRVAVAGGWDRR